MKKTTFYLLLVFFASINLYGQNKVSYETKKGKTMEFTYFVDEFYVTFESTIPESLKSNDVIEEVLPVYSNTAIIKINKAYNDITKLKTDLNRTFNNTIKDVDITLGYEGGEGKHFSSKNILIRVKEKVNIGDIEKILKSLNVEHGYLITKHKLLNNLHTISFQDIKTKELFKIVSNLNKEDGVIYSEPNFVSLIKPFNDPFLDSQWSIENNGYLGGTVGADMKVKPAWNISTGAGVKVAVLDEGVQLDHPDLVDNLLPGLDATASGSSMGGSSVFDGHGTRCAGVIAAVNNNIGVRGVAYDAKIIPVRIGKSGGLSWIVSSDTLAYAFEWAKDNGADIISNSWGNILPSKTLEDEIYDCVTNGREGKGCVVLFATGNSNASVSYPAKLPYVIAVGGSSMCDERKSFTSCDNKSGGSNYGDSLSFVAPGVDIYTTDRNSNYTSDFRGTSAACPNAAGVAALVLSINPDLTSTQVRDIMERNADKIGGYNYQTKPGYPNGTWEEETGYGRLNAYKAVMDAGVLDLYMRNSDDDTGDEPDIVSPYFHDSPDVWIRNNDDNGTTHQNAEYHPTNPNYVYVRVHNRGTIPSTVNDSLEAYWAKGSTSLQWDGHWNGSIFIGGVVMGDTIGKKPIPILQPGQSTIIKFEWLPKNPNDYNGINPEPWHFCLAARINSEKDPMTFPETSEFAENVQNNNNIAWKNLSVVDIQPNSAIGGVVYAGNPYDLPRAYRFKLYTETLIYEEAEVKLTLDPVIYNAWIAGGGIGTGIISTEEQRKYS